MRMKPGKKWIGAAIMLTGCATASDPRIEHDVRVLSMANDFLQTREVAVWSIPSRAGRGGDRWPAGLSLNARAIEQVDGTQQRFLMLRSDVVSAEQDSVVYEQVRRDRARLHEQCTTMTLVQDGRVLVLPVHAVTVRALTGFDRMPVAATDSTPDPVEVVVGNNTSDRFVMSTTVQAQIEPDVWRRFASVQTMTYEFCGQAGTARPAELEGLREVVLKSASPGGATANDPRAR